MTILETIVYNFILVVYSLVFIWFVLGLTQTIISHLFIKDPETGKMRFNPIVPGEISNE